MRTYAWMRLDKNGYIQTNCKFGLCNNLSELLQKTPYEEHFLIRCSNIVILDTLKMTLIDLYDFTSDLLKGKFTRELTVEEIICLLNYVQSNDFAQIDKSLSIENFQKIIMRFFENEKISGLKYGFYTELKNSISFEDFNEESAKDLANYILERLK